MKGIFLLGIFARHPVAANLLMLSMLLSGVWGLSSLNVQFFPNFEVEVVTVRTVWNGASAEDVERALTLPLEQALRNTDNLDKMTSTSAQGASVVSLEFPEGIDMGAATNRVEELVKGVRNLPVEAETPDVVHVVRYEPIARLLVYGPEDIRELRSWVHQIKRELLDLGIAKVNVTGLPEEEIAVQIPQAVLQELALPLSEISQRIADASRDLPAGTVGRDDVARELRTTSQQRNEKGFAQLVLLSDNDGQLLRIGDIADIERRAKPGQVAISYQGKPAVELSVQRSTGADSLQSAQILRDWWMQAEQALPPNIQLKIYDETWQLIEDRINLLLRNGLGGLLLVVCILFLFLNGRVAAWVTVGIPVSFMLTLAVVYLGGGSINMISLFALIMALGIIVDDAIVVGEDALTHYQTGEDALQAAEGGAQRMFAPVMSSSLTTIAAFIPLFAISGFVGKLLGDIPFVIVCVIIASLIESFLVLPGHLRHSFMHMKPQAASRFRQGWDAGFARFRDGVFRNTVVWAINNRLSTLAMAFALLILLVGLIASGRLGFAFFPNVPGSVLIVSASFVSGTPPQRVENYINQVEQALYETNDALGGNLLKVAVTSTGVAYTANGRQAQNGDQFASIVAELTPTDAREVSNRQFLQHWEGLLGLPPGLEYLTFGERQGGHPGRAVEIRLTGGDSRLLKQAALDLSEALGDIPGMQGVEDDMPYGQQQLVYEVNAFGESLGLNTHDVGRQLRGAFDGYLTQVFNQGDDEIEVRVMLPDSERHRLAALQDFNLFLPNGETVSLLSVVDLTQQRGFKTIRHADGGLAVTVYADVDKRIANANAVREQLKASLLPDLVQRYGIEWEYTGRAEDQRETASDMKRGALFALAVIYIVLAWVFGSYTWPLVVMSIIPFGFVGAFFGHWAMGVTPTILSMFGLFALSGIVVNDSIILVVFYKHLRKKGIAAKEAVTQATCQRLRAVLLTSLTTIAGLTPLLFETSVQAQFLIPMAVSISFGLAFSTFMVLFLLPALLSAIEQAAAVFPGAKQASA